MVQDAHIFHGLASCGTAAMELNGSAKVVAPLQPLISTKQQKHEQINQTWHVLGEPFDLPSNLRVVDYLGAGAYGERLAPLNAPALCVRPDPSYMYAPLRAGVVCAAQDASDGHVTYAIKKCKKIFQSRTLAKRTLRELRLLRCFDHANIIKVSFLPTTHSATGRPKKRHLTVRPSSPPLSRE